MAEKSLDLPLAEVSYKGHHFKTGLSVTFPYTRNTVSARSLGLSGSYLKKFQVDIEPAGKYLLLDEFPERNPLPEWVKGTIILRKPLVLKFNTSVGGTYDDSSWKMKLFKAFKKKGRELSMALKAQGYDGIVTVDGRYLSEIVQL